MPNRNIYEQLGYKHVKIKAVLSRHRISATVRAIIESLRVILVKESREAGGRDVADVLRRHRLSGLSVCVVN